MILCGRGPKLVLSFSRRTFLTGVVAAGSAGSEPGAAQGLDQGGREYWVQLLARIAEPVLSALSQGRLAATMPVEAPHGNVAGRRQYTYLEAFGRLLAGIAPWLELGPDSGPEGALQKRYAQLARQSIAEAVNPSSPDHMNFTRGSQPLVDAAFLALAVLRAPREFWKKLDRSTSPFWWRRCGRHV